MGALIAAAPGKDRAFTAAEEKQMANAVVVDGGGYAIVRAARLRGERGPQVAPKKQRVSVRYSPGVLQYFKSTGPGWQTRMNEALLEWVSKRSARSSGGGAQTPRWMDFLLGGEVGCASKCAPALQTL